MDIQRKIAPVGNTVVCRKIKDKEQLVTTNVFTVKEEFIPEFEVISLHYLNDEEKSKYNIKSGDVVFVSSTGTSVIVDKEHFYLFKPEHIIGIKR